LNIYFLSFRIFEELLLDLKTEFALTFFKPGGLRLVRLCVRLTTPRGAAWLDGTRGKKFGAPVFEPDVFRKQMYSIEQNTCDTVGTFGASRSDPEPGEMCPLFLPRYTPDHT